MSPAPLAADAIDPAEAIVGTAPWQYRAVNDWAHVPAGWNLGEVPGVATDSAGHVFLFARTEHPILVFDRAGNFLRAWGEGLFHRPHGLTIGPDDAVYCVDDAGHAVHKFTPQGQRLWTLGTVGQGADTGAVGFDYRTIQRAAGPFNCPTNLAVAPSGDLYIADGYGNARIHRYSAEGKLLHTWGEPGAGPGQFHVPHGIAVTADGTVLVCDRENDRIQRFTPEGQFIDAWTELARPCEVTVTPGGHLFVAELGYRAGMFPGNVARADQTTGGRVSILAGNGQLLARFGGGDRPCAAGDFFAPHDIMVDCFGDFYVGEVTLSAGGNRGLVPPHCPPLRKFTLLSQPTA